MIASLGQLFRRLLLWLARLWGRIPPETKREIIETAIEVLREVFKSIYRKSQAERREGERVEANP